MRTWKSINLLAMLLFLAASAMSALQNRQTPAQVANESDLSGTWSMRVTDPYAWYEFQWDVKPAGPGEWDVEQTLIDTSHGFHAQRKGQKFDSCILVQKPNGEIFVVSSGADSNPGNPGVYRSRGRLRLEQGELRGKGEHIGSQIKHSVEYVGRRKAADALSGTWKMRITDPYAWYDFRWEVKPAGSGTWIAEQTLIDTNHGVHAQRKGQRFHSFTLKMGPDGTVTAEASGGDPNPANPGHFSQAGTLRWQNGKLTGRGEHKGSSITHWMEFNGTRDGGGSAATPRDELSGVWTMRISDPYAWYDYRWDVRATGPGTWIAEQTLIDTSHGVHAQRKGQRFHSYTLKLNAKGEIEVEGTGTDPNPADPGKFVQTATLSLKDGSLEGKGEHRGGNIRSALTFKGSKNPRT